MVSTHAPGLVPEERPDVGIQHPAHLPPVQSHRQRIVLAASGAEPIGEPGKVRLIDRVQRRYAERPQAAIRFRDVLSPRRLCPVGAPLDPSVQVRQLVRQTHLVLIPRHPIHTWSRGFLQLAAFFS
jgi:hypothetical protein